MKNSIVLQAILLGGVMILSAGCVKESYMNDKYRPAGSVISFSPSTGYENGTGVRTEYSGQLFGNSPKYERINWVVNDPMKIFYVHGSETTQSRFQVTAVSAGTDEKSTATVDVAEGSDPLIWSSGDDDHLFYAMYPTTGFGGNSSASLTGGNHVSGSVPAPQEITQVGSTTRFTPAMQYAYMVAYKCIDSGSMDRQVTLPFTPAVTAFEFKLQRRSGSSDMKVTSVTLTSKDPGQTPLTGTFAFDITGGDAHGATWNKTTSGDNPTVITGAGYSVTATFPEGGISLPGYGGDDYLDFTLFALPVEQTNLEITLSFLDGSTRTLALKNAGTSEYHVFAAAKKHVIRNTSVPDEWEYTIDGTGTTVNYLGSTITAGTVTSYRQRGGTGTKYPVAWTVEGYYLDEDCTQPVANAENWISDFNGGGGSGSSTGSAVTVTAEGSTPVLNETITDEVAVLNALVAGSPAGTELGSASNYKNLSNPSDMDSDYIAESANSYIVNQVGYYKIPLVMGNSIKGNAPNSATETARESWQGHDGSLDDGGIQDNWRVLYQNYRGNFITDPWLMNQGGGNPVSAEIIWEDVEGLVETKSDLSYDLPDGCISSDGKWLYVHVPAVRSGAGIADHSKTESNITLAGYEPRQGNALIAVKDASGTIMWSYHIWVTDYVVGSGDLDFSQNYYVQVLSLGTDNIDSRAWNWPDGYQGTTPYLPLDYYPPVPSGFTTPGAPTAQGYYTYKSKNAFTRRMMPRNLGWVEYGQTLDTDYPTRTLYVKLSQDDSGLTKVVPVIQQPYNTQYRREYGSPTYQYGRSTPLWPTDHVHTSAGSWSYYGKYPSFGKMRGTMTLAQSIQFPYLYFTDASENNEKYLSTLAVPGWPRYYERFINGDTGEWNRPFNTSFTSSWTANTSMPTNLWNSVLSEPLAFSNVWTGMRPSHAQSKWWLRLIEFPHPPYFGPSIKSVYSPTPAGYGTAPSIFLLMQHNGLYYSPSETVSGSPNRYKLFAGDNVHLFKNSTGKYFTYYTSSDPTTREEVLYPKAAIIKSDGSMSYDSSDPIFLMDCVCVGTNNSSTPTYRKIVTSAFSVNSDFFIYHSQNTFASGAAPIRAFDESVQYVDPNLVPYAPKQWQREWLAIAFDFESVRPAM